MKRFLKVLTSNESKTEKIGEEFEQKYKIIISQDTKMLLFNFYLQMAILRIEYQ
ncbi:unnamed protein product [Paramecium sonneborni]|uniref:Uncharacterized protein n=1 Tax=Paramecium sonneborni TaxID=65129 RepID=A0A8S1RTC4_9CILI|nr:unnamed protein product [Paramecium sonneborni]